jgi:hypothetical protein
MRYTHATHVYLGEDSVFHAAFAYPRLGNMVTTLCYTHNTQVCLGEDSLLHAAFAYAYPLCLGGAAAAMLELGGLGLPPLVGWKLV